MTTTTTTTTPTPTPTPTPTTTTARATDAHAALNALPPEEAREALASCCGSRRWVEGMLTRRPFASMEALLAAADAVWRQLERCDFLEAFAHHPPIGERADARGPATEASRAWSAEEQARAVASADGEAAALRALNQVYAARFGHTFIICATSKSAGEILAALRARLANDPEAELAIAADEQSHITRLRLEKLAQ